MYHCVFWHPSVSSSGCCRNNLTSLEEKYGARAHSVLVKNSKFHFLPPLLNLIRSEDALAISKHTTFINAEKGK